MPCVAALSPPREKIPHPATDVARPGDDHAHASATRSGSTIVRLLADGRPRPCGELSTALGLPPRRAPTTCGCCARRASPARAPRAPSVSSRCAATTSRRASPGSSACSPVEHRARAGRGPRHHRRPPDPRAARAPSSVEVWNTRWSSASASPRPSRASRSPATICTSPTPSGAAAAACCLPPERRHGADGRRARAARRGPPGHRARQPGRRRGGPGPDPPHRGHPLVGDHGVVARRAALERGRELSATEAGATRTTR